jgi:pyruvate kinase
MTMIESPLASPQEALADLRSLRAEVAALRDEVLREAELRLAEWDLRADSDGARNLACYLALRSRDLNELQLKLAAYGLSSLGRSEADVLTALDALLASLNLLCGDAAHYPPHAALRAGEASLVRACDEVFGDGANSRTRIMATMPSEAADDPGLVLSLVEAGMNCARINCAHDDAGAWTRMAENARAAARRLGRPCRVLMDIAGPKLRIASVRAPQKHRLAQGDRFRIVFDLAKGKGVAATLNFPGVVSQLAPGAEISFDDGKAVGRVVAADEDGAEIEITAARARGLRFKPDKGVNLPNVALDLPPLTEKDLADLDVIVALADLVGFSFVQRIEDVALLDDELNRRGAGRDRPALVLKIETPLAVRNLPALIVAAAARRPTAVMIARGDLAVEVGFARLSEMQEEILWLCQAAHVPVIWATQVLDQLIHEGVSTRPETTDAAMGQRADCVMLNKGPYLLEGVRFLDEVLGRMQRHQSKKFPRLARLRAWSLE